MISFYKEDTGVVMYKDDTYLDTMMFVVDRPAVDADVVAHPDEHAAFLAVPAVLPSPVVPEGAM